MSLPDQKRRGITPPARALAASLAHFTAVATWRTLHPATREPYVEAPAPRPLSRLYYDAPDGWRSALLHLPAAPSGAGEPVVLLHALGFSPDAFRYGTGPTLAGRLAEAGFSVYLLAHRGDREAVPPLTGGDFSFDDIVEKDLPAAIERAAAHADYPKVHLVGHGLGGQLAMSWAGRSGGEGIASVVAMCAPVRFARPASDARGFASLTRMLPSGLAVPIRALSPFLAPWVDSRADVFEMAGPGVSPPPRLRGVLHHAVEDVPIGLLQQLERWLYAGSIVDRTGMFDYTEAMQAARVPLMVLASEGDRTCPSESAIAATQVWGGSADVLKLPEKYGHLDALLAADADTSAFQPITAWLSWRRRLAWD